MDLGTRVLDLVMLYEELRSQGKSPTPEELCRESPELLSELRKRIGALAAVQERLDETPLVAADPLSTTPPSEGDWSGSTAAPSNSPCRYRPLRYHARGGLGEVHVARDAEIGRDVALKRIQARHRDNPDSHRRFLREAEITGRLEHPGIVPVYGVVQDADGQPCYAMRFIDGETLQDAVHRFHQESKSDFSSIAFRDLLQRFVAVCNTMAYAHSKGVIHRDLKPANIMLGKYGETLVVDWGLAKVMGQADSASLTNEPTESPGSHSSTEERADVKTHAGHALGTPVFMSPEQAAGRWDEVGPGSDIYSLGATLYVLLTGQPPIEGGQWGAVKQRILEGAIQPPRQMRKDVPRPLEAVCLKALTRASTDRYTSARDLSNEVERWLADEPVTADREPMLMRVGRWSRKHRALVTGAVAVLLVSTVAAIFAALLLNAKNTELHTAYDKEQAAHTLARDRKQLADENFILAVEAVKDQVFDIHDSLRNLSGTHSLREKLQKSGIDRLKKLVDRAGRSSDAEHTTAMAHVNLGDVYLSLDNRSSRAVEQYRKAYEIAKSLTIADLTDAQSQRDLSISFERLGDATLQAGQRADAREYYTQSLEILKKLAAAAPADARAQRGLSIGYNKLGDVTLQEGLLAAALEYYNQGLKIRQKLIRAAPTDAATQRDLSTSLERLGMVNERLGMWSEAAKCFEEMYVIKKGIADRDPSDALAQREVSVAMRHLGDIARHAGFPAKALEYYMQGLEICKKLAAAAPTDAFAHLDVLLSYYKMGAAEHEAHRFAAAADWFERASSVLDECKQRGFVKEDREMLGWWSYGQWVESTRKQLERSKVWAKVFPAMSDPPAWPLLWGWPRF